MQEAAPGSDLHGGGGGGDGGGDVTDTSYLPFLRRAGGQLRTLPPLSSRTQASPPLFHEQAGAESQEKLGLKPPARVSLH